MSIVVTHTSDHVIPLKTGRGLNNRETWRQTARRVANERSVTLLAMGYPRRLQPGEAVQVTLVRVSRGHLDDDNNVGALKHVRDAVAQWLGIDDGSPRIRFLYGQRVSKRIPQLTPRSPAFEACVEVRIVIAAKKVVPCT